MKKEEIKKILETHLQMLSKISCESLKENPVLLYVVTESLKGTSMALLFIDEI